MSGSDGAGRVPALMLLVTITTLAVSGCYVYQPLDSREPPVPGQDVRIRVESPHAIDLQPWQRGALYRPSAIEGRVIEWRPDTATLAVFPPPAEGMSRASPHPDTVRVPVQGIASVELKELSRTRSAAFGVGAGLVGALVVRALFRWTRVDSDVGDPPATGS